MVRKMIRKMSDDVLETMDKLRMVYDRLEHTLTGNIEDIKKDVKGVKKDVKGVKTDVAEIKENILQNCQKLNNIETKLEKLLNKQS